MRNHAIDRMILILIVFLLMSVPVQAQELEGNTKTSAAGQTAVTARVEMPADESEDSKDSETVKTGDESKLEISILLLLASITVLLRCVVKKESVWYR